MREFEIILLQTQSLSIKPFNYEVAIRTAIWHPILTLRKVVKVAI